MALIHETVRGASSRAIQTLFTLTVGASSLLLAGCGFAIREGAQHAHIVTEDRLPVHSAIQYDMLPEALHAKACANPKMLYDVRVLGSQKSLSRGEQAAVLEALNGLEGKADIFYLTRSWGTLDDEGRNCGEVWGRGLRMRVQDTAPPAQHACVAIGECAASATPAAAPEAPTSTSGKAKMGF